MNKTLILSLLLLLFSQFLFSQDYLGDDAAFFENKVALYQHWLEAKGLGKALKVDKFELKMNGHELEFFLLLRTADPDSAAAIWLSLETTFRSANPGEELTDVLFKTFVRMMEIPPGKGNMQVYIPNLDRPGYNPCFYIWIWGENGKVLHENHINNCKAQPLSITVQPVQVKKVANQSASIVSKRQQASQVFDKILEYAKKRYEVRKFDDRNPRLEEDERTDYMLQFHVNDLSKEVLKEEDLSAWCKFLESMGFDCNDMRRERLEFTFYYNATDEGYQLSGTLTGKFGSGVYQPREKGWMDMEPDFEDDFLKPYVKGFQKDLKLVLER